MKSIERRSFADLQEFREYAWNAARLVYYYVFDGTPDQRIIDSLAGCGPDEALVLIAIVKKRGRTAVETGLIRWLTSQRSRAAGAPGT